MATITSPEKEAVKKLRNKLLEDLSQEDDCNNDALLLRFLRDQDMNISSAETTFRKYINWKKNVRQKQSLDENTQEGLRKRVPLRYGTLDRTGRPVFILPIGQWAAELTADLKNSAHFVEYFNLMMDKVVSEIHSVQKEGEIELALGIVDLGQLTYKQLHKDVMPLLLSTVGDMRKYYPEIFYHVLILNAPRGFSFAFKLVKAIIPARYTDRITIYGKNRTEWVNVLLQNVAPEQLCKDYGGEYDHKL